MSYKRKIFIAVVLVLVGVGLFWASQNEKSSYVPKNLSDVVITLKRNACYGFCPEYKLTIYGDGRVIFDPKDNVEVGGISTTTINGDKVLELISKFKSLRYFSLMDKYDFLGATDMPSVETSLTINNHTKSVYHYHGDFFSPKKLTELENKIDEIINTRQWVGDPGKGKKSIIDLNNKFEIWYRRDQEVKVRVLYDGKGIQEYSYIPICDPATSAVCIVYTKETYPNSNFSNAGVSVGILTKDSSETQCYTPTPSGLPSRPEKVEIGGVSFERYSVGDAAAGHQSIGYNYRAFHSGVCYELTSRINTTTYENYEPETIQRFTDEQRKDLEAKLFEIIKSFRFDPTR